MTEKISVTAAELAFLLGTVEAPQAAGWLRITEEEQSEPVRAAGIGSLLLRDLATHEEGGVRLGPEPAAIAEVLATTRLWVAVGVVAPGAADAAVLCEAGPRRLLFAPRANRIYQVRGLDADLPLVGLLTDMVDEFLGARPEAAVSLKATSAAGSGWVALGRAEPDGWTLATPEEKRRPADRAEALAEFSASLSTLVARLE